MSIFDWITKDTVAELEARIRGLQANYDILLSQYRTLRDQKTQPAPDDSFWKARFADLERDYAELEKLYKEKRSTGDWQKAIVTQQAVRDLLRALKVLQELE